MTSVEAAEALARGIDSVDPSIECVLVPMADGGEGTTEALVAALDGEWVEAPCHDALGRPATGRFGLVPRRGLVWITVDGGNGYLGLHVHANTRRDDVARAFPAYGARHGFDAAIFAPPATYRICATMHNTGAGHHQPLGCKTVTSLPSVIGSPACSPAADGG